MGPPSRPPSASPAASPAIGRGATPTSPPVVSARPGAASGPGVSHVSELPALTPAARPGAAPGTGTADGSELPGLTPVARPAAAPASAAGTPRAAELPGLTPVARPAPIPSSATAPGQKKPALAPIPHPPGMRPARPTEPAAPSAVTSSAAGSKYIVAVVAGTARGQRFRLLTSGCWLGRSRGAILFPDDPYVSPQHAAFRFRDEMLFVRDEASVSGVYVSIAGQELIAPGTLFSAGQRLFRFTGIVPQVPMALGRPLAYGAPMPPGGSPFGVEEVLVGGRPGRAMITSGPLLTIGQAHCDLSFPGDPGMAPRHLELTLSGQGAILRDLSGGLGTFVRLSMQERPLRAGDKVRIGQQLLQIELARGA